MAWEVHRVVNEEGLTILGPYRTRHMAELRADQDRARLARFGYDLVWYDFAEMRDGTPERVEYVHDGDLPTQMG
jgi:hypothetical protein